jgi:predicted NAD-dependent protein-ADP-ribosyltransferase YbiA (DUF1768 family)
MGKSMNHGLDTDTQVFFYEQDFYVLSNFSAFQIRWEGLIFQTSEHVYHYEKFPEDKPKQYAIRNAPSAHMAFKIAEHWRKYKRPDCW